MITIHNFKYVLLTVVLLELFLGGTGRLVELNSFLTLRMCLFMAYMGLILYYFFIKRTLPADILIIVLYFCLLSITSTIVGLINGAAFSDIFEDIKPCLNIFLLFYLGFSIKHQNDINYVIKLLKLSAVLLTLFHIAAYCIFLKYSNIGVLYAALSSTEGDNTVFLFKGESGFLNYTGDIYLCIGFIAWEQFSKSGWQKYAILLMILIAIVLTGTRGLIFALAAVYCVNWLFLKLNYRSIIYLTGGLLLVLAVYINIKDNIGDKDESDQTRYEQIDQVLQRVTPLSTLIGHGYGIGVPIRPIHMEISYLEIFHKQGIAGLFYYFMIWFIAYRAQKNSKSKWAPGLYMFLLFIFFVSATNPYVNHPLGITTIAIAIVSLLKLNQLNTVQDKLVAADNQYETN